MLTPRQDGDETSSAAVAARRIAPFALCGIVTFALLPVTGGFSIDWLEVAIAAVFSVLLGAAALFWPRLTDGRFAAAGALVALLAIALIRDATGGARGGYGVLVIVPVLWVALYGRPRQLWTVLAGVGVVLIGPLVLLGAPHYTATSWRSAPLILLVCVIIGVVVQELLVRERAGAERQQRISAQRQRLLNAIGDGVLVTDLDGRALEVNPALCAMTGYDAGDLLRDPTPLSSWPDGDAGWLPRALTEAIAAGGGQFEARLTRRDGSELIALVALAVDRDPATDSAVLVTIKDVTERVQMRERLQAANERAAEILGAMREGFALTRDGEIVDVNPALCEMTGFTREQLIGARTPFPFWPPELIAEIDAVRQSIRANRGGSFEATFQRADGSRFVAETTAVPVPDSEGRTTFLNTMRDVTERKRAETATRERGEQLAALATVARAVAHANPDQARETVCEVALNITNAATATLWELGPGGALAASCVASAADPTLAIDLAALERGAMRALSTRRATFVTDTATTRAAVELPITAHFQPVLDEGRVIGVLELRWTALKHALTEAETQLAELLAREASVAIVKAAAHAELERLARTDPLTGLPNRRALETAYVHEIASARRTGLPLTLALLDLDHFKAYNDAHGHLAGDVLLRTASENWMRRLRATDTLARWGGEEFCLLLPGCDLDAADQLIESLRAGVPHQRTFSAGLVAWRPGTTGEQLISQADQALYSAKRGGRNRTVVVAVETGADAEADAGEAA